MTHSCNGGLVTVTFLSFVAACNSTKVGDEVKSSKLETHEPAAAIPTSGRLGESVGFRPTATVGDAEIPNDMIRVLGTEFFMGVEDPKHGEVPGRLVTVPSFAIDRLEVTVGQYLACQREGKCTSELHDERGCNATSKPARLNHPMNCVTWYEADSYCKAVGKRLPTSSEWELTARGTDRRPYPWGSDLPGEQLCWQGRTGKARAKTCEVGTYPQGASPYGVLDLAGNVSEYTATVQEGAYPPPIYQVRGGDYVRDPVDDPNWTPQRVDLGGSGVGNPTYPQVNVGFRCARDVGR